MPVGLVWTGAIVAALKRNMCCKSNILSYYHILSARAGVGLFFSYFSHGFA